MFSGGIEREHEMARVVDVMLDLLQQFATDNQWLCTYIDFHCKSHRQSFRKSAIDENTKTEVPHGSFASKL